MSKSYVSPRERLEEEEKHHLRAGAALSTDERYTRRTYHVGPDEFRTQFHRDYTRIIHSRAFRRLRHKTQVFISPKNDHICTRMEHSLHVASVATTITRAMRLNEDLVRAIAVGHDLGHAPFGHKGERSLNDIALQHGLSFSHELHSLRVVEFLDSPYRKTEQHPGLNLTFAVRDGIACHYGEGFEEKLVPDRGRKHNGLDAVKRGESRPATLEGCVVRWADKVAYLGRDLEDAYTLELVRPTDLPGNVKKTLGTSNGEIIGSLVRELSRNAADADGISVSLGVHEALNSLYDFSMERIYKADEATHHYDQIDRAMQFLFEFLLDRVRRAQGDLDALRQGSDRCLDVFAEFLQNDIADWRSQKEPQLVLDFIAGMTDSFFAASFTELFLPRGTV